MGEETRGREVHLNVLTEHITGRPQLVSPDDILMVHL